MSDPVRLALLIGGFTLIAIAIAAGAILISQWMRQHRVVEQRAAKPQPPPRAGMGTCIGSGMSIVGNIRMQWSSAGLRANRRRVARVGSADR